MKPTIGNIKVGSQMLASYYFYLNRHGEHCTDDCSLYCLDI